MPRTSENGIEWYSLQELVEPKKNLRWPSRMDEGRITLCEEWIALHLKPTKTIRETTSAYSYKHDVERWTRTLEPRPWIQLALDVPWTTKTGLYIAEEAFIEAMVRSGYRANKHTDELWDTYGMTFFNATLKKRRTQKNALKDIHER